MTALPNPSRFGAERTDLDHRGCLSASSDAMRLREQAPGFRYRERCKQQGEKRV